MIRVLLVEDDPVIRDTTCYFLKSQQNFEVVCAETGGDALSHARERFDVILMDIEMETTTAGIHAAENILAENPDAIVIFLTAHETENMILMSMGAGAVVLPLAVSVLCGVGRSVSLFLCGLAFKPAFFSGKRKPPAR